MVGEDGKYLAEAGLGLAGMGIFTEGSDQVLELLGDDVMHSDTITHSYPYDWRTKKPVFLRASKQWFINTDKLKQEAIKQIETIEFSLRQLVMGSEELLTRDLTCVSPDREESVGNNYTCNISTPRLVT